MIRLDIKCHVEGINLEDGGLSSEGGGGRVRGSGKDRENVGTGTLNFISQWRKLRPERGRASCSAAMAAVAGYRRPSGLRPGACTLPQFRSLEAKREGSAGPRALRALGKNPSLARSGFQLAAAPRLRLPVYTRPPSPLRAPSALRPSAENTRDHMEGLAG